MDTSNDLPDVQELMNLLRAEQASPREPLGLEAGDLSRLGLEAMVRKDAGTARLLRSSGVLRFTGPGVSGHSVNLDDIGTLSSAWQKAVTATGAALEKVRSARGSLPLSVRLRTQLVLTATPQPGSVIFNIEPKEAAVSESEPHGQMVGWEELAERPLADKASERLLELLEVGADGDSASSDVLAEGLKELGPRVGGALMALVSAIESTDVSLDVSWREPAKPTRRVQVDRARARFIAAVVQGRGLDAEEETLEGTLQTISTRQRWAMETAEGLVTFDAAQLSAADLRGWSVNDRVEVDMLVQLRERGDGTTDRSYSALRIRKGETGTGALPIDGPSRD